MIKADLTGAMAFVDERELSPEEGRKLLDGLYGGHIGREGSGWLKLPIDYGERVSDDIKKAAGRIAGDSAVLVVIGIGGSYLGARAAIDFVKTPNYNLLSKKTPDIYFVGNNLSGDYLEQVIALIGGRDFSVSYISKSGSTIEPSVAFRVFKGMLTAKYGVDGAKMRIYVTTDPVNGQGGVSVVPDSGRCGRPLQRSLCRRPAAGGGGRHRYRRNDGRRTGGNGKMRGGRAGIRIAQAGALREREEDRTPLLL
jgi:glucose-6-phosphate isomerase